MPKRSALLAASFLALALCPTNLFAQCVDQPRKVTLDKNNVVPLKSYLCTVGTGADAAQFRVEYFRLTDFAVSLMLANASSVKLQSTLGASRLLANDVSRTYADLVKQFGVTEELIADSERGTPRFNLRPPAGDDTAVNAGGSNAPGDDSSVNDEDKVRIKKLRTLLGFRGQMAIPYPANDEIAALRKKSIAANLNYYYSIYEPSDQDEPGTCTDGDITCIQDGRNTLTMKFWRSLTVADIDNYAANAKAYNAQLLQIRKDKAGAKDDYIKTDNMGGLRLVKFIANGSLPNDFLQLTNFYAPVNCGDTPDQPGVAGWRFDIEPRNVTVDAIRIENISRKSISLTGLYGAKQTDAGLRAVPSEPAPGDSVELVDNTTTTLAPGQSVLALTNITFGVSPDTLAEFDAFREKMESFRRAGANGFTGSATAYRSPDPKDYTYGPVLTVTGAQVNGTRLDFVERPLANFIEMSLTGESGSCPYLLSWDETDREWITHGKVLHKGQGKGNAYTETLVFPALRTHFRIEEREPELAHLQRATLALELRDGTTQTFSPVGAAATGGNGGDISLMWGETADLTFAVPDALNAEDVRQTRLLITGYYQRYTDLLGEQARSMQATPVPMRANAVTPPTTTPWRAH